MEPNPIIFLDFDGVICTTRAHFAYANPIGFHRHLDPVAVKLIERLMRSSKAEIVVSSTWRIGAEKSELELALLNSGMGGVNFHSCWRTPSSKEGHRGKEIEQFFQHHNHNGKFLILDDDSDFLDSQKPFHVKTHPHDGFLWEHYEKSCQILGVKI